MKKLFMMLATAALAFGVAGCDKNGGDGPWGKDAPEAGLRVSFTVPDDVVTRAGTQNANGAESTLNTIEVFIFNQGVAVAEGAYTPFTIGQFTPLANGRYELTNASDYIQTVEGTHNIYVGVNLPGTPAGGYTTEAALLKANATVAAMSTGTNFAMFSPCVTQPLDPYDETNPTGSINTLTTSVGRVVAKLTATTELTNGVVNNDWTGVPGTDFMTYTIKQYNVYNENTQSYLFRSTPWSPVSTFATSRAKANKNVLIGTYAQNGSDNALRDVTNQFYIGENAAPTGTPTLNGNTTYAFIATQVRMHMTATWDNANNQVLWVNQSVIPTTENTTLYVVPNGLETYIVADAAPYVTQGTLTLPEELIEICSNLGVQPVLDADGTTELSPAVPLSYFKYKNGWVHFPVYLNPGTSQNAYKIDSNMFIHLVIDGIKNLEGVFPGYPGIETTPEKPIDPTELDPNNPWYKPPTDPVDDLPAQLDVHFDVKPWDYVSQGAILE